ncbi:MAG TPA: hypothetical protein VGA32_04830 [Anaerolineales bacterium]
MVLRPGETVILESGVFMMHTGMEGPHVFRVHILSNDPQQPHFTIDVSSNWVP